jgi:hypothetical protein
VSYKNLILLVIILTSSHINAQETNALHCKDNFSCEVPENSSFCSADYSSKLEWDSMSDTYILSCNCDCTSQENNGWIAKKNTTGLTIYKTSASLVLRNTDIINWNGLIPGAFGPSPLCSKIDAGPYDLLSLTKVPSEGADPKPPYCYISEALKLNENNCTTTECQRVAESIKEVEARSSDIILTAYKNTSERLSKTPKSSPLAARKTFIDHHINTYGKLLKYQQKYNDIAFYWQKAGYDEDAIWLLKKIINTSPKRTVAYLNIADSLWNLSKTEESTKNYEIYIDQMKINKKEHLIPQRAFLRTYQK